jgi:hypothetical protein
MATRAESISEVRSLLDDPYQQAPNLHKIVAGHLRFEQLMCNRLNNTGRPWAVKTFDFDSDPDTDTYDVATGTPAIAVADFGKPLVVVKATGNANLPFIQVSFDDYNQQDYGTIPLGTSDVTPLEIFSPSMEKVTFYREGIIGPVRKMKLNPVPQTVFTYTVSYLVGAIGRDDAITVDYGIPEHSHLVEIQNALSQLPYCKWTEDPKADQIHGENLKQSFLYQLGLLEPVFAQYVRDLTHGRPVEVNVCY